MRPLSILLILSLDALAGRSQQKVSSQVSDADGAKPESSLLFSDGKLYGTRPRGSRGLGSPLRFSGNPYGAISKTVPSSLAPP
jgi:hypothetical protein